MSDKERRLRIAIVDADKCKPRQCRQECRRSCPVNAMGKLCVDVESTSKTSVIYEDLCNGCGICVKKCPLKAIQIINLPKALDKDVRHIYGHGSFRLFRLPVPRSNNVVGLVGTNGIGKSTALKILSGRLKPNLGRHEKPPGWEEILKTFRGSALQNYFELSLQPGFKSVLKPQYVDQLPRSMGRDGTVAEFLAEVDDRGMADTLMAELDLVKIADRQVKQLSGGELQRFAIAYTATQQATVYMFDEPSSYLDVKQRLKAAQLIRRLASLSTYVIVVEHDLSILDYMSDYVCVLYGVPGAYGIVTMPSFVREGINIFLDGFIPTENMRFRDTALTFSIKDDAAEDDAAELGRRRAYAYPSVSVRLGGSFRLRVEAGSFTESEIVVLLGENGTGKSTFMKMLAGRLQRELIDVEMPKFKVSSKKQQLSPKFEGTVKEMLEKFIPAAYVDPMFNSDVLRPMNIAALEHQRVSDLSGGELQRVAIVACLGTPADVYLLDEPSAYLDAEQRVAVCRVIKRFIMNAKKTAFVVEHDFIMATYLADRVIVYDGEPSQDCVANAPQPLVPGLNKFLRSLNITFHRDRKNLRPRVNKLNGVADREQKLAGNFFAMGIEDRS